MSSKPNAFASRKCKCNGCQTGNHLRGSKVDVCIGPHNFQPVGRSCMSNHYPPPIHFPRCQLPLPAPTIPNKRDSYQNKRLLQKPVVIRHAPRFWNLRSQQPSRSLGRGRDVLSASRHSAQVGFLHHGCEGCHGSCLVVVMGVVVFGVERVIVIGVVGSGVIIVVV